MTTPKPVIVGTDGSPHADDAVLWAARYAARHGSPLRIVTAADIAGAGGVAERLPQRLAAAVRQEAWKTVDRSSSALSDARVTVPVTTEVVLGRASAALIELSEGAEAVIVGARGLGAVAGAVLGSVSAQLARHASCPVVVVPPQARPTADTGPVVVGIDGSPVGAPAVAAAFREAAALGAPLVAVHAWSDQPVAAFHGIPVRARYDASAAAQAVLAEQLAGYAAEYPDVAVAHSVVPDLPEDAILHAAERARLIVVGTRGRGGVTSMLLGSTAQEVLRSATCPVLVAR